MWLSKVVWFIVHSRSGFFVFKQKTAYEMRISDWSSDVCSSDLPQTGPWHAFEFGGGMVGQSRAQWLTVPVISPDGVQFTNVSGQGAYAIFSGRIAWRPNAHWQFALNVDNLFDRVYYSSRSARSEEHTSELQSLMRISYAVFCLKKKKNI